VAGGSDTGAGPPARAKFAGLKGWRLPDPGVHAPPGHHGKNDFTSEIWVKLLKLNEFRKIG
jgi:hypothetical protein